MTGFGFATLCLVAVIGMAGPLLAAVPRLGIPVVVGELVAGIVVGRTGFDIVDTTDPTFTLLANVGFALVMFVVGTHVPVRDASLRGRCPRRCCERSWSAPSPRSSPSGWRPPSAPATPRCTRC